MKPGGTWYAKMSPAEEAESFINADGNYFQVVTR